jgi:hypothetical protein
VRANQIWSAVFPSLGSELSVILRKPADTDAQPQSA